MKKNKNNRNHRQCLISKKRMNKNDLYRFVKINDEWVFDENQSIKARGYYISKNLNLELIDKQKNIIKRMNNANDFLEKVKKLFN